jgi:hypothetical protein
LKSQIDDMPGVGKARRKMLLDHFGSFDGLKNATLEDLAAVPGLPKNVGKAMWAKLHPSEPGAAQASSPTITEPDSADNTATIIS